VTAGSGETPTGTAATRTADLTAAAPEAAAGPPLAAVLYSAMIPPAQQS